MDASEADVRSHVFRQTRARQLADLADRAGTPAAKRQVFAEALLTHDADAIRLVGLAVTQGLEALAARYHGRDHSTARNAMLMFRDEFDRWQRANPSPAEQLARIERGRGQMAVLFEESAQFALSVYGLSAPAAPRPERRPAPPSDPTLKVGPAFDKLLAGNRHARR